MSNPSVPQTEPRSIPVQVPFATLPAGSLYCLTSNCFEQEKMRGQEEAEVISQAEARGLVYVWLTESEWERATAPLSPVPARVRLHHVISHRQHFKYTLPAFRRSTVTRSGCWSPFKPSAEEASALLFGQAVAA